MSNAPTSATPSLPNSFSYGRALPPLASSHVTSPRTRGAGPSPRPSTLLVPAAAARAGESGSRSSAPACPHPRDRSLRQFRPRDLPTGQAGAPHSWDTEGAAVASAAAPRSGGRDPVKVRGKDRGAGAVGMTHAAGTPVSAAERGAGRPRRKERGRQRALRRPESDRAGAGAGRPPAPPGPGAEPWVRRGGCCPVASWEPPGSWKPPWLGQASGCPPGVEGTIRWRSRR